MRIIPHFPEAVQLNTLLGLSGRRPLGHSQTMGFGRSLCKVAGEGFLLGHPRLPGLRRALEWVGG